MFQTHLELRVYQQDNARPHTARISMDFLNNANIRVIPWPALSPDLAPIEHAWDELGRRVYIRSNKPTTIDGLRPALTEEWKNMPQTVIQNIILSMCRRCTAYINATGGHTRYRLFDLRVPLFWSCCVTTLFQIVVPNVTCIFSTVIVVNLYVINYIIAKYIMKIFSKA